MLYRGINLKEKVLGNKKYIDIFIFDKKLNLNNNIKIPDKEYKFRDIDIIHLNYELTKRLSDEILYNLYFEDILRNAIDFEIFG